MEQVISHHKVIIDNNAINEIFDKIINWKKNPHLAQAKNIPYTIFWLSLGALSLNIFFKAILARNTAIGVNFSISLVYMIAMFTLLGVGLLQEWMNTGFSFLKGRFTILKAELRIEIDFINWLQKFRVIERELACERIMANHNKNISLTDFLPGLKLLNLGAASTILRAAASAGTNIFGIDIFEIVLTSPTKEIIVIAFLSIGIMCAGALIDLHSHKRLEYFIGLIKKSIQLSLEANLKQFQHPARSSSFTEPATAN